MSRFMPLAVLFAALTLPATAYAAKAAIDPDYPDEALRNKWEGRTGFSVIVDIDGRASDCAITASSGFPVLDEATCKKMIDRARFDPARDANGEKITSEYRGTINWKLSK